MDHAAISKEPSSVQILAQHRVRSVPNESQWTALHHAVHHHNDLSFIIPLVTAGCEIDLQVADGDTPLSRAASAGNDIIAAYLIEHGANINSIDKWGNTPLMNAVRCGSSEVLKLLLERGADCSTVNWRGHTILHDAVDFRSVNIETLKTLKSAGMKGIDTEARNAAGLTAVELMQRRSDISDEFRLTFEALLESIKPIEPMAPMALSSLGRFERFERSFRGPRGLNDIIPSVVFCLVVLSLHSYYYWVELLFCFALTVFH